MRGVISWAKHCGESKERKKGRQNEEVESVGRANEVGWRNWVVRQGRMICGGGMRLTLGGLSLLTVVGLVGLPARATVIYYAQTGSHEAAGGLSAGEAAGAMWLDGAYGHKQKDARLNNSGA